MSLYDGPGALRPQPPPPPVAGGGPPRLLSENAGGGGRLSRSLSSYGRLAGGPDAGGSTSSRLIFTESREPSN